MNGSALVDDFGKWGFIAKTSLSIFKFFIKKRGKVKAGWLEVAADLTEINLTVDC